MNYQSLSKYRGEIMGIATLMIMLHHVNLYTQVQNATASFLLYCCNMGVEIFLFVSAIGLYYSHSKPDYRFIPYYKKRIWNVYIPYLIIFLPFAVYNAVAARDTVVNFMLNYTGISFWYLPNAHNWYIHFSMLLYFIYPLIYKAMARLNKHRAVLLITLLCIADLLLCVLLNRFCPVFFNAKEIAITRIASFLLGCFAGKLVYRKETVKKADYFIILFTGLIGAIIKTNNFEILRAKLPVLQQLYEHLFPNGLTYPKTLDRFSSCLLLPVLMLLFTVLLDKIKLQALHKTLAFFGSISLEAYLLHTFLSGALMKILRIQYLSLWQYGIVLIATVILSIPYNQLRKYLVSKVMRKKSS